MTYTIRADSMPMNATTEQKSRQPAFVRFADFGETAFT
jgi:hypothetical protein